MPRDASSDPRRPRLPAAIAGIAAVVLGLGVAELSAGLLAPPAGPVVAIGGALVDLAPTWGKDAAIALFGTGDKAALVVGVGVVLVLLAAVAGLLDRRLPPLGRVLAALAGIVGAAAAVTRPDASALWALPSLVGAAVAIVALPLLLARAPEGPVRTDRDALSRRGFLLRAGGAAAVGVLAAAGGWALQAGSRAATVVRQALRLPAPANPAPPLPAGSEFGEPGLSPIVTPNGDFYRIDISLLPPQLDPAGWTLRVHGLVDRELTLTWDDLTALPLDEYDATLMCVSNEVGGGLIGTARWLGYPVRDLLARVGVRPEADMAFSRGADGFTAGTPIEALTDPDRQALLVVGMNGEPLPIEHGFPVRFVVPGLYGYVSATKWVTDLELTRFDRASAYWTDRGWSPRGPVKLESRIDVPRAGARVPAGSVTVAGVAWHQHVGVGSVDVQVDDGEWVPAELSTPINADTWIQWRLRWSAGPGEHRIRVRATGADGEVQTEVERGTVPDGATGLHTVLVQVG